MEYLIPEWLRTELSLNHSGIEIKWMKYGQRKEFILPLVGDAFYRMVAPTSTRLPKGTVMYRRHITMGSPSKWRLHPLTYLPSTDVVTDGRWVVFQTNMATDTTIKLFDVVYDDGSLHPLDRRVLEAIQRRDRRFGAHEKAIKDVEETVPQAAEREALEEYKDNSADTFGRIFHDIKKEAADHALGDLPPDPLEDTPDGGYSNLITTSIQ